MTEKELKHLNRSELLELLLAQTRENERLQEKLRQKEALLSDRILRVQEAGDLAHAVLEINGVMEAAQAAAQQYLDNMEQMERRTKEACDQMLEEARKQAEEIRGKNRKPTITTDPENYWKPARSAVPENSWKPAIPAEPESSWKPAIPEEPESSRKPAMLEDPENSLIAEIYDIINKGIN